MTNGGRLCCNNQYDGGRSFRGLYNCMCICYWNDVSNLKGMASRSCNSVNTSVMASNDVFIYTVSGQRHLRLRKSHACGTASASRRFRAMLPVCFHRSEIACCSQRSCNFTFWVIQKMQLGLTSARPSQVTTST